MSPAPDRRPPFDRLLAGIADYMSGGEVRDADAYRMARLCLMDSLGCAFQALGAPDCLAHIGPVVPGTVVPHGARVPGTAFVLDPVKAAYDTSCLIRWLDFSDTWSSGGHPSDNLGALLALADHLSRVAVASGRRPLTMRAVLDMIIRTYEVHGSLITHNTLDAPDIGLDSAMFVKVASAAGSARLLGCSREEMLNAISNAFVDGGALNIYRKGATAGARKSWAAPDAAARGLWFALLARRGEMGYASAITAKTWGFEDVLFKGRPLKIPPRYGTHVVNNIQFKIAWPAQRHSQTAAECAVRLHPAVRDRLGDIREVVLTTHALAERMISVTGPLPNFAARDHCLQYVTAVGLIFGDITHASYEDGFAADPRIDALRARMTVRVDPRYTRAYEDPKRRANPNSIQVFFRDGSKTEAVEVEYLLGDPPRRAEGLPRLQEKFRGNVALRYAPPRREAVISLLENQQRLEETPVNEFMDLLAC